MAMQTAILAGGCFWGVEELIRALPGVIETKVGYTGGDVRNATYRNHGSHAEGIKVTFDENVLSYRTLLEFFFQIHNPTTLNQQGNDIGMSYRSAIFYLDDEQQQTAIALIRELTDAHIYPNPIVTVVTHASDFWDAEEEHQDYLQKHPNGYTCHFIRPEWKLETAEKK
jgi:peptide-methionine (S)-S-oxide reductase